MSTQETKNGDLVRTEDGYYGIVVDRRDVFLGNGTQLVLDDMGWAMLTVLPLSIFIAGAPAANFLELVENRAPIQDQNPANLALRASRGKLKEAETS